jgi:endosialidase-like protein
MASDIKLHENAVVVEGNVGVGTSTPVRKLHVEGSEIHSGGAGSGFSFADRTKGNGERWLWYAQNGEAHLWSQKFGVNILTFRTDTVGIGELAMPVGRLTAGALTTGLIEGVGPLIGGPAAVTIQGNVKVTGTLTQASSSALKENVAVLSGQEAMVALQSLKAVKYTYKADAKKEQHLGFIAEDVPDLVASTARDRLSLMDLIAVLTKAMQEQQQTITDLAAEVRALKERGL